MSKHCAYKRIRAARAALRFPALLAGLEDASLSVAAINLLAPHLTEGNAAVLIEAARSKPCEEIEALLAARFPSSEFLALGEVTPNPGADTQLAARRVDGDNSRPNAAIFHAGRSTDRARLTPVAADRDLLNLPIRRATTAKLKHAAELMSHTIPSGDMAEVLDRALDLAIAELERRKCAKTGSPRPRRSRSSNPRHVPAHVRRAVRERDGGQCTFVGDGGHRCGSRSRLEFDHAEPVARGGDATIANIRLRCRAHNQYDAERLFGAGFMHAKRERIRSRTKRAHEEPSADSRAQEPTDPSAARRDDISAALRRLGYRADETRRALAFSETRHPRTADEQLRAALRYLMPKTRKIEPLAAHRAPAPAI